MTQGIVSSLNMTLARLSSIESNFGALEALSDKINSSGTLNTQAILKNEGISRNDAINKDFKAILEEKIKNKNKEENKPVELNNNLLEKNISGLWEQQFENTDSEEDLISDKVSLNLKDKINLKAQSANIDEIIETFANKYNVDSDFIKAIIQQESGYKQDATSKKGAMGLMQLMPKTAKAMGVNDAYNPYENIEGGVKYFKGLLDRFENDKQLALAAYNAGPNAVKRYGGVPPYKETQNYVNSIMSAYNKLKGASL